MDDLGGSKPSKKDSDKLIAEYLGFISMKIESRAVSGLDPSKELSDESVSVPFVSLLLC